MILYIYGLFIILAEKYYFFKGELIAYLKVYLLALVFPDYSDILIDLDFIAIFQNV